MLFLGFRLKGTVISSTIGHTVGRNKWFMALY